MIGHIAYLAALNAPEIADALTRHVGEKFAQSMYDQVKRNVKQDSGYFLTFFSSTIGDLAGSSLNNLQNSACGALIDILKAEGVAVVASREIELLRELAGAAIQGSDIIEPAKNLKTFYESRSSI